MQDAQGDASIFPSSRVGGQAGVAARDTIAAIATAPGRAGVAVVRISGDEAFQVASAVAVKMPRPGSFAFARMRDSGGKTIDEGVVLVFKAPASYTGEDVVELQCHGGVAAPRRVLEAVLHAGARLAKPGEFTMRAFLSGKMSLDKAQSVIDLIDAKTGRAADAALAGRGDKALASIYRGALDVSARIEHALDIDEGALPDEFVDSCAARIDALCDKARGEMRRLRERRLLLGGALVVISGPVNAGKSSLFNALAGSERAIVSSAPGTTRDAIEAWLDIDGWPVRLVDTAGLRGRGADEIEAEGMRRAKNLAERADVVLDLSGDGGYSVPAASGANVICVSSKCDIHPGKGLRVSSVTGEGLDDLKKAIAARLEALADESPALGEGNCGEERIAVLDNVARRLEDAASILRRGGEEALVFAGNDMRMVCNAIAPFTGDNWTSDVIAALFSRFCVGK